MPTVGRVRAKIEGADRARTVSQKADSAALRTLLERVAQQAARLSAVVANALEFERRHAQPVPQAPPDPGDPRRRLTPRERQVLDLVVEGRSSKEIARSLGITRATARCHVQNMLTKLGVGSRVHAAALAAAPLLSHPTPQIPTPEIPTPQIPTPQIPSATHRTLQKLTARETEVLRALAAGLDRREIAAQLYLSPHTVRTHVQRVLAKLDVHSVLSALALARTAGLEPLEIRRGARPQTQAGRPREAEPARPRRKFRDRISRGLATARAALPDRHHPLDRPHLTHSSAAHPPARIPIAHSRFTRPAQAHAPPGSAERRGPPGNGRLLNEGGARPPAARADGPSGGAPP